MVDLRLEQDVKMLTRQVETLKERIRQLETAPVIKLKFSPSEIEAATNFIQNLCTKPDIKTHVAITAEHGTIKEEVVLTVLRNDNLELELRVAQYVVKSLLS